MEILDFFTSLIDRYGYIIVTLAIMLESAGVPMPGETALIVAAAFAGAGHLNIALVIACAAFGAIAGDAGGYWAGRKLGRPFIDKYGKWLHLTPKRMTQIEALFLKHGPLTVFFGRFFALLRTYAALFAGVWRMPYGTFTLYNALGGIFWSLCFGIVGYLFGQNLPLLEKIARTVGLAISVPVIGTIICLVIWRLLIKHQAVLVSRSREIVSRSFIGSLTRRYSWQIHWILRHWTAAQYTVMHVFFGLVVAIAGTWAFVKVSHSAFSDQRISFWDHRIFQGLQESATPFATTVFNGITAFGSYGMVASVIAALLIFALGRKWLRFISVAGVVLGGQFLNVILKLAYARPSPVPENNLLMSISFFGFSFPSTHTMGSLIAYGIIAYFLILWAKRWKAVTGIVLSTVLLVALIGFSRIYLGLNYLSDVLCGVAGGAVWLSSCITALELLRRGQVGDRRRKKRVKGKKPTDAIPAG